MTPARRAAVPLSLASVRRKLTAWYAGTFFVVLALLGIGLFNTITHRFDVELDDSLRRDANMLVSFSQDRDIVASFGNFRIPDRQLSLTDSLGNWLAGARLEPWAADLAHNAWRTRAMTAATHDRGNDEPVRAVAQPLPSTGNAHAYVVVAIANEVELEDRYSALIVVFIALAIAAVILVILSGWAVARQAMAPSERAFEHMRRFMADAAHELRTPITVVRSRAGVALQQRRQPDEYKAALHAIEQESERLGGIVNDLLMLARADAGQRTIERKRIFLDDVMLDATDAARAIASRREMNIVVDEYEEAPVVGDEQLLRQLVLIQLDNAIKYTDQGGSVHIGVHRVGTNAVLTVRDTGIGIPEEQLPHVFERFYRGDTARTRTSGDSLSEGAGLGLSIAQWIAEEHMGAIRVESAVGTGTTVTVELPLA